MKTQHNTTQVLDLAHFLILTTVFFSVFLFSAHLSAQYQYIVTGRVGVPIIEGPNLPSSNSYPGNS